MILGPSVPEALAKPAGRCIVLRMQQHPWLRRLAGRFLVFEGPDGSGKSTQFARLAEGLRAAGVPARVVKRLEDSVAPSKEMDQIYDLVLDYMI